MARHMRLDAEASFRAVVLRRIPGLHNYDLKTYIKADGTTIDYHTSTAYGPYASKAAATGQITKAKMYEGIEWVNGAYVEVEMDAFVEVSEIVWKQL